MEIEDSLLVVVEYAASVDRVAFLANGDNDVFLCNEFVVNEEFGRSINLDLVCFARVSCNNAVCLAVNNEAAGRRNAACVVLNVCPAGRSCCKTCVSARRCCCCAESLPTYCSCALVEVSKCVSLLTNETVSCEVIVDLEVADDALCERCLVVIKAILVCFRNADRYNAAVLNIVEGLCLVVACTVSRCFLNELREQSRRHRDICAGCKVLKCNVFACACIKNTTRAVKLLRVEQIICSARHICVVSTECLCCVRVKERNVSNNESSLNCCAVVVCKVFAEVNAISCEAFFFGPVDVIVVRPVFAVHDRVKDISGLALCELVVSIVLSCLCEECCVKSAAIRVCNEEVVFNLLVPRLAFDKVFVSHQSYDNCCSLTELNCFVRCECAVTVTFDELTAY